MVFEDEKCEKLLIECVELRNEHQFIYILDELNINPDKKLKCFNGLSTFEKVLMTADSKKFIEICILNGSNFYTKNVDGIYPLHYAINSFCADNLETILKPGDESFTKLCDDHLVSNQYSMIVNEKLDGENNYLHFLIDNITVENYEEVSKMMKNLLLSGCYVNSPNFKFETPFYLLLKNPLVKADLINFFIDNTRIDYYSYNSDDIICMMEKRNLHSRIGKKLKYIVDLNFMTQQLGEWNEQQIMNNMELFRTSTPDYETDLMILLEESIIKDLPIAVSTLMKYNVSTTKISKTNKFRLTPAFIACIFGHHKVLKVLLNDVNLSFQSKNINRNLLHQILSSDLNAYDRQKCFDLIIADRRCTLDIINQTDGEGRVPLFYTCQYGCDEITRELLRRGAYIGYESVLNCINKDVLEGYLDDCVKCSSEIMDKNCELYIDYKCLMPSNESQLEVTSAYLISEDSKLKDFILHPVIASFVLLKWKKIESIVYFNLLIYFIFMLFLGFIIIDFYNIPYGTGYDTEYCRKVKEYHNQLFNISVKKYTFVSNLSLIDNSSNPFTQLLLANLDTMTQFYKQNGHNSSDMFRDWDDFQTYEEWKTRFRFHLVYSASYVIGISGLLLMTAYEIVQFLMSWKKYFFKAKNWLDIMVLFVSFFVLWKNVGVGRDNFKQICAIMILLIGAQSIQVFSRVSAFSFSLHMAILNKVCGTFLKTIAPYLMIICAFGMSFYALNFNDYAKKVKADENDPTITDQGFSSPFMSTISTVKMMLSDFSVVNIEEKDDLFKGVLFLAFMVGISIILLNLLNALAISDTNEMMKVAEFVETKKRISTLRSYGNLFYFFKINYLNVFPKLTTIMLTPNKHNFIKVKKIISNPNNFAISMQKTGKVSKFEYLPDNRFWKRNLEPLTFDESFLRTILEFVKKLHEKKEDEMNRQHKIEELIALKIAQENIYKELQNLKSQ